MKNTSFSIYIALFVLLLSSNRASAQQENHYTMFMYNKIMYNPAFAGARGVGSVHGLYRGQWYGFEGAPSSQQLGLDLPIGKTKMSIAANASRHKIGIEQDLIGNIAYSYALVQTATTRIALGIDGGYRQYNYDFTNPMLYIRDGTGTDASILTNDTKKFGKGNIGAGLQISYKGFYMGFSAPNLYENRLGTLKNAAGQKRHLYGMIGGILPLSSTLDLRPSASVRYVDNAPLSIDANLSVMFRKRVTLGASYRMDSNIKRESVDAVMYLQMTDLLGFGVSYDYTLSMLNKYNKGSIEAILRYDFGQSNENGGAAGNTGNMDNPRFFF